MFDTNKDYWLYIEPHVYCCIKNGRAILYNTQTAENIETGNRDLIVLLKSLYEKKNLGAVSCRGEMLAQPPYRDFMIEFCKKKMGNTAKTESMPKKPVQMLPVLNLQHDIDKDERHTGEEVFNYLTELNLYINTRCEQQCPFCNDYSKQNLCCRTHPDHRDKILHIASIRNILQQIKHGSVGKLNLLGGDIFQYPHYRQLPELFGDFGKRVHIWNHYTNCSRAATVVSDFSYDIAVTFPMNTKIWKQCIAFMGNAPIKYHFYITNEEEHKKTAKLVEEYKIDDYSVRPVYTTNNLRFFEEYVYLTTEDIVQTKLSMRQIFAHQKMNTFFFGSLTILPDGEISANLNSPVLGNISNHTLLDIIDREMRINTAWRKIRDMYPCSECLYQYLCPSPSNYETVINKPDLCHIKK